MKFLDLTPLARINSFLDHVDVGEYFVYGDLEAYSCKLAGLDKKLSRSLDQDMQTTGSSPVAMSPVGPLAESASRKTLIYLILTLNHIYPDYDFSLLRASDFTKERGVSAAEETVDSHLIEVSKVWEKTPGFRETPFLDSLWNAIDEAVELKDCTVYSYKPDFESDPFGEQMPVWSFNYFFYNRKMKRIVYLSCRAVSKATNDCPEVTEESSKCRYNSDDDDEAVDYGMAKDMDV